LNNDLQIITPTIKNNKKDILINQLICSQYALQLKHGSMRASELSLFLSLEKKESKHNEVLNKFKTYIDDDLNQ
jgi:hypothetical protein